MDHTFFRRASLTAEHRLCHMAGETPEPKQESAEAKAEKKADAPKDDADAKGRVTQRAENPKTETAVAAASDETVEKALLSVGASPDAAKTEQVAKAGNVEDLKKETGTPEKPEEGTNADVLGKEFDGAMKEFDEAKTNGEKMKAFIKLIATIIAMLKSALEGTLNDKPADSTGATEKKAEGSPTAGPDAAVKKEIEAKADKTDGSPEALRQAAKETREEKEGKMAENSKELGALDADIDKNQDSLKDLQAQRDNMIDARQQGRGEAGVNLQLDAINKQIATLQDTIEQQLDRKDQLTEENKELQKQIDAAKKVEKGLDDVVQRIDKIVIKTPGAKIVIKIGADGITIKIKGGLDGKSKDLKVQGDTPPTETPPLDPGDEMLSPGAIAPGSEETPAEPAATEPAPEQAELTLESAQVEMAKRLDEADFAVRSGSVETALDGVNQYINEIRDVDAEIHGAIVQQVLEKGGFERPVTGQKYELQQNGDQFTLVEAPIDTPEPTTPTPASTPETPSAEAPATEPSTTPSAQEFADLNNAVVDDLVNPTEPAVEAPTAEAPAEQTPEATAESVRDVVSGKVDDIGTQVETGHIEEAKQRVEDLNKYLAEQRGAVTGIDELLTTEHGGQPAQFTSFEGQVPFELSFNGTEFALNEVQQAEPAAAPTPTETPPPAPQPEVAKDPQPLPDDGSRVA